MVGEVQKGQESQYIDDSSFTKSSVGNIVSSGSRGAQANSMFRTTETPPVKAASSPAVVPSTPPANVVAAPSPPSLPPPPPPTVEIKPATAKPSSAKSALATKTPCSATTPLSVKSKKKF